MALRTCEKVVSNCNLQIVGSHSDRHACNEAIVEVPKLVAKLTDHVYGVAAQPGHIGRVWEFEGYKCTNPDNKPWYMVFLKTKDCTISTAPKAIIAVRGTLFNARDIGSDFRVLFQHLEEDKRYAALLEVVQSVLNCFGHKEVAMAGHSLGAAFVLLVGKCLVKSGTLVETYLFNPPFASFDIVGVAALRKLEKSCKAMLLALNMMVSHIFESWKDRVILLRDDYRSTLKWIPHMFINKGDLVNQGYLHQIYDRVNFGDRGFWAKVYKWVEPHTLLSLINNRTYPKHLLPSFNFTIAGPRSNPYQSHKLEQWHMDPEWKEGDQVEGLAFGRQLCQRLYVMERKYIPVQNSDARVMVYYQTLQDSVIQTIATTAFLGLATSKQFQVVFLFNTEQDAETAEKRWPSALRNYEFRDCIRYRGNFEFRLHTVKKGAVTFYVYAVRQRLVPFERELEWRALIRDFEGMKDVTNWIKRIRHGVWLLAIL